MTLGPPPEEVVGELVTPGALVRYTPPAPQRPVLRPYQEKVLAQARDAYRRGVRRMCLVLPCGAGKTVCFSALIAGAVAKGSRALVLAHRRELVEQTSRKLSQFGVDHGVIMAGHRGARSSVSVQVASVQTLSRRLKLLSGYMKQFNVIVPDEAHHLAAESQMEILRACAPDAVLLGATATPERLDGKPLGGEGMFEELIVGPQTGDLIELGALVPIDGFSFERPDLRSVKKHGGDYNLGQLDAVMKNIVLGGNVVRDYLEFAKGTRALVFAVTVEHSKAMVEQAKAAGVPAAHFDADTPLDERAALLGPGGLIERGEILFASNVGVATEGTDVPSVETVILARPTCSLTLGLQMMGRGMRPYCFDCRDAPKPECKTRHRVKTFCRLHDHAGVIVNPKIGPPDLPRKWSLTDAAKIVDDKWGRTKTVICPKCSKVNTGRDYKCKNCGFILKSADGQMGIVVDENANAKRLSLDEIRARRPPDAHEVNDVWLRRIANATREEKCAEYLRLCHVQMTKNLKHAWIAKEYKRVFGVTPKFTDEELKNTKPAQRSFLPIDVTRRAQPIRKDSQEV